MLLTLTFFNLGENPKTTCLYVMIYIYSLLKHEAGFAYSRKISCKQLPTICQM